VSARGAARRTGRFADREGARRSNPWVIRGIVALAVVVVVAGIVYAAVNGILFSLPSR
jgi:hypothetical protein